MDRVTQLEGELRKSVGDIKLKQERISIRGQQLDAQETKIVEKENKMKTLVEDEKRRSQVHLQANTKEFRNEIMRLKDENKAWEIKYKDLDTEERMAKHIKRETGKRESTSQDYAKENEDLKKKIAELEIKLEHAVKAKTFYKTAFENAEIRIQHLTEENNRNKSNQLQEQKEEIGRLRSELASAGQRNEERLMSFAGVGTNATLLFQSQPHHSVSPLATSNTLTQPTTVIPINTEKVEKLGSNENDHTRFGNHAGRYETQNSGDTISRLQSERAMFMKTNVYTEEDPIIKQLDANIKSLLEAESQK